MNVTHSFAIGYGDFTLSCLSSGLSLGMASTLLTVEEPQRTISSADPKLDNEAVDYKTQSGRASMEGGYTVWMGQPVVLRVVAGNLRVPLRGRLVSETNDSLRLRIADNWDVDIFKSMVVAVEQDMPTVLVH